MQRTCIVSDSHATAFSVLAIAKDSKVNTIELSQGNSLDDGRRKGAEQQQDKGDEEEDGKRSRWPQHDERLGMRPCIALAKTTAAMAVL
jgi:hypothetical protein